MTDSDTTDDERTDDEDESLTAVTGAQTQPADAITEGEPEHGRAEEADDDDGE